MAAPAPPIKKSKPAPYRDRDRDERRDGRFQQG
jgi:hypothetical protein